VLNRKTRKRLALCLNMFLLVGNSCGETLPNYGLIKRNLSDSLLSF